MELCGVNSVVEGKLEIALEVLKLESATPAGLRRPWDVSVPLLLEAWDTLAQSKSAAPIGSKLEPLVQSNMAAPLESKLKWALSKELTWLAGLPRMLEAALAFGEVCHVASSCLFAWVPSPPFVLQMLRPLCLPEP